MAKTTGKPLSDSELEELRTFLATQGDDAMDLEMMDGFFSALICAPDLVMPSEYLPWVWGDDCEFESEAQAKEIMGLAMRHWNSIGRTLQRSVKHKQPPTPLLFENKDGVAPGNRWALGFVRAIDLRPESWHPILDDDEQAGMLVPMMMLAHEHDPDPELRPPPIDDAQRETVMVHMIAGLMLTYRFFEPVRRTPPRLPAHERTSNKVGRNEPCPCGSGRKYKRCCGASVSTVH